MGPEWENKIYIKADSLSDGKEYFEQLKSINQVFNIQWDGEWPSAKVKKDVTAQPGLKPRRDI